MKILHIGKYYAPFHGGIENFMAALLSEQVRQGHEVHVLVHNHQSGVSTSNCTIDGVKVVRAPIIGRWLFSPISVHFPFLLRRLLREIKPDIVHIHMPNPSAFWLLLFHSALSAQIVIHWHADVLTSDRQRLLKLAYSLYRPLERLLLARVDRIIVTSPPYLESSKTLEPWRYKSQVIPLGLAEADSGQKPVTGSDKAAGPFRVLCVGRLTYYKGHQYLIEAASEFEDCEVLIVGIGENLNSLQTTVRRYNCVDRVKFLGEVEDSELRMLYQQADCLCLPSIERTEAFGMVLLEAMRESLPVIVSNVVGSGMIWVVRDNETGLLVAPENANALAAAFRQLRSNREFAVQLGIAGRQRFENNFTIATIAVQIDDLYKSRA